MEGLIAIGLGLGMILFIVIFIGIMRRYSVVYVINVNVTDIADAVSAVKEAKKSMAKRDYDGRAKWGPLPG